MQNHKRKIDPDLLYMATLGGLICFLVWALFFILTYAYLSRHGA